MTEPAPMTDRNAAVAMIVMAKYLAGRHPTFGTYMKNSYEAAVTAGLTPADLSLLKTILGSIGVG